MTYPAQALDSRTPLPGDTGEFSQIKALDAKAVEFDLCFPDVAFLSKVAFSSNAISQKDYLTQHVADGTVLTQPNGTGPYMVKEWVKGDHITYVANPNYWGEQPAVPTAILRWGTEPTQRLTELQSGVSMVSTIRPRTTFRRSSRIRTYAIRVRALATIVT